MTAAVEAAEVGYRVILVEKDAYLGGRVMRMHRYFPKMCPPTCGFEINVRRIRQNPRITVHTLATVEELSGTAGRFMATIKIRPRYVTGERSLDDSIAEQLTSERANDFNLRDGPHQGPLHAARHGLSGRPRPGSRGPFGRRRRDAALGLSPRQPSTWT